MTRDGFLPQVTMRMPMLGQNGNGGGAPAPAPSPAPSGDAGGDNNQGFNRFPFFPTFPSFPFYWQQPYYPPAAPARPRYICKRTEDSDDEERFICEPEEAPAYAPPRTPVLYVRPYAGSWFY